MILLRFVALMVFCFMMMGAGAQTLDNYTQPEYKQWTGAFKKGELDNTIAAAEKSMLSDKPNHYALLAWYTAHKIKGDVNDAVQKLDSRVRPSAIMLKDILHFDAEQMSIEAYKKYTPEQLKKLAGPYGLYEWGDLVRNIDPLKSYSLMLHGLQQYGEYFRFVWAIDNLSMNNMDVFNHLHADLKAGKFDSLPTAKDFLLRASATPFQINLNDLITQETYLKKYPEDAIATRFRANRLLVLKRYEEAAKLYLESWEIDPYYVFGLSLKDAADAYARAGKMDEALSLTERYASLYFPDSKELKSTTEWASTLLLIAHNSEARSLLEDKKEKFDTEPSFQLAMAQLERASKRPEFALRHSEQAYKLGPKTEAYAAPLVDAYITGGKPASALEVINRLEADRQLSLDFYYSKARVFENAAEYEEAYLVRKKSVEQYPASSWHWNNFAYTSYMTKRYDEAHKAILKSLSLTNPSAWACGRLYDYTKARFDEAKALATLEEYAKAYPWNEYLWKEYANKFKSLDKKVDIYRNAIKTSGDYFHPYKNLIDEYLNAHEWDLAVTTLKEAAEVLTKPDDIKELIYYESEILRRKGAREKLSMGEINQAVIAMNRYANLVGAKDGYWFRDMSSFMIFKNDLETSALYLDSGLMVAPDADYILTKIRNNNLKEYGVGKFSRKLYEYVQRDPYDIDRYVDAMEFHAKWGGSPLVAIVLGQRAKELIPDDYSKVSSREVLAYGKLGDNAKDFELRYAKDNTISPSERYIDWYNISRHNVWKGSSKITVDPKTMIATIQFPDGTVAQRQDDLITGSIKMLQVGNAYIKADYNQKGSLTSLDASNGRRVQLQYDDNNKIIAINTGEGTQLSFEYNSEGKLSKMSLQGVGHIEISYDEYGESDEVKSFDENGKEAGTQVGLKINSSFRELSSLTDVLQKARTLTNAKLPDLGIADEKHDALYKSRFALQDELNERDNSKIRSEWFKKSVELARYLKDNTHINADYAEQCIEVINQTRDEFILYKHSKILMYAPQFVEIFHDLLLKTRRNGVALAWWNEWIEMQEWLQKEKLAETKLTPYRLAIEKVQEKFKTQPIELLSSSEWLPKSVLQNEGYWKKFSVKDIIPAQYQGNLTVNTLFKRSNGDILVGTNKGLLIRHHGYWDHFSFNPLRSAFERDMPETQIKASSDILSIAESDTQLLLGTADGLLVLSGEEYLGKIKKRYSQLDGLPVSAISAIAVDYEIIYLGTSQGLLMVEEDYVSAHDQIKAPVNFIHKFSSFDYDYGEITKITIGTDKKLWVLEVGETNAYTDYKVDDASVSPTGDLFILKDKSVMRFDNGVFVELYGNVITTDAAQVYGLAMVPVTEVEASAFTEDMDDAYGDEGPQSELAPAVLTDMGMSLYHDKHFEHFYLPLKSDRVPQARKYAGEGNGFAIYTGDDVYVFELDQVKTVTKGAVNDIISSDVLKKTFIAKATGLYYVDYDDPAMSLQLIDYISPDALALDKSNRLIVNDGAQILRYTWLEDYEYFEPQELFYANQFEPKDVNWIGSGGVKNILVAKNDVVWVATKLSVFRYEDKGEEEGLVEEYNYFRAPDKFPSRTHMVYRVLENPDGRIWAVCSNEGHLAYNGIYMRGGLLQWNESKKQFDQLDTDNSYPSRGFNWFVTSITPTGEDKAIVGTLGGFAEYNNGEIRDYDPSGGGIKNSSYDAISKKYPSLFMGTRGEKLGDLWLFGSASGILAYRNGVWMYPDRLNQMLPQDREFGNYGGRLVTAIATDTKGRIYAGTDLGLLMYDSQGADPMSFLINNGMAADAFSAQNEIQLQEEKKSVIKSIPKSTSSGKIITELQDVEKEIKRLQHIKANSQQQILSRDEGKKINSDSLTTLIADKNKKHYELLLRLEKQDPAIHQLLDVKPVEVATLRKNLREGECIVQYIPTARKLYIQVLAKDKVELREAIVSKDSLMRMSQYVANGIKFKMGMEELAPKLEWLYDQLLRPIENDIAGYNHLMVIPVQSLYYIPFAALRDKVNDKGSAYAIDRFNIAYVSSTYLLGLLLKTNVESTDRYLLFGDPDGSLPGASAEVKAISEITSSKNLFMNKQATLSNLMKNASGSRVVHLATHGYLNERFPEESSILLADNKLTMPQIFNLPLDKTDMIVLSACETGKGASKGMEYATIARAFANAGSPTVLATLWKVDDSATRELMIGFYSALKSENSKLLALTHAQRKFITKQPDKSHPYYWAGFILMGKP